MRAASALAETLGAFGQDLIDEFWPGPLTLVFRASPTLKWDLGDTNGTVAVRMPLHPVALELLRRTGPIAVSSANKTGQSAATTADDAQRQLGDAVAVYLDGGPCADNVPSTIVDLTAGTPRVLRVGAISVDQLRKVATMIDLPQAAPPAPASPTRPPPRRHDPGSRHDPGQWPPSRRPPKTPQPARPAKPAPDLAPQCAITCSSSSSRRR